MSKKTKNRLAVPTQEQKEFETNIEAPEEEFTTSLTPVADTEKKEDTAEEKKEETPKSEPVAPEEKEDSAPEKAEETPDKEKSKTSRFLPFICCSIARASSKRTKRQKSRKIRSPRRTRRMPNLLRRAAAMSFSVLAAP